MRLRERYPMNVIKLALSEEDLAKFKQYPELDEYVDRAMMYVANESDRKLKFYRMRYQEMKSYREIAEALGLKGTESLRQLDMRFANLIKHNKPVYMIKYGPRWEEAWRSDFHTYSVPLQDIGLRSREYYALVRHITRYTGRKAAEITAGDVMALFANREMGRVMGIGPIGIKNQLIPKLIDLGIDENYLKILEENNL